MAHQLAKNTRTGKAAMAWVRADGTPWHGLGECVEQTLTGAEMIVAAGQDYEVLKVQAYAPLPEGPPVEIPGKFATVRRDTGDVLGMVGKYYRPVQNVEAYSFLDALVRDGGLRFHTAGAMYNGARVWMLAKLPGEVRVTGDDVSEKYLLFANGHDGGMGVKCLFTPIRVVCQNTLSAALDEADKAGRSGFSFNHVGNLNAKLDQARRILGLAEAWFATFGEGAALLARTAMPDAVAKALFAQVYPVREKQDGSDDAERIVAERDRLLELFHTGVGLDMPGVAGTAWAAVNAVAEHLDHDRPDKTGLRGRRTKSQLSDSWFGSGRPMRTKAWQLASAYAAGAWQPAAPVTVAPGPFLVAPGPFLVADSSDASWN